MKRRIVISGVGCVTPIGSGATDYWQSLSNGVSGSAEIKSFDHSDLETKIACQIKDWNPADRFDRKEVTRYRRHNLFALQAVDQCIKDAGLKLDAVNLNRIGVLFSSCFGGIGAFETESAKVSGPVDKKYFSSYLIPNLCSDMTTGVIAHKYGFTGVNYAIGSACSSSLDVIIEAYKVIMNREADIIIAGGTEAPITEMMIGSFSAMRALSRNNANPQAASRPFDRDRDGFVMGEGAGCVVVETLESAQKRGASIYAEIIGWGKAIDIHHITSPNPDGMSSYQAMRSALKMAKIVPERVDHINAHATSTPLGDVAEARAIRRIFADAPAKPKVSAIKSMTGHLLGAAGVVTVIASLLSIEHQSVLPTINVNNLDPEVSADSDFVVQRSTAQPVNTSLVNAFGFGGKNSSILLQKMPMAA